jgi:GGDEF domain-containing protein
MVFNDWAGFVEGDLLLARLLGMARAVTRGSSEGATLSLVRRDVLVLVPGLDAPAAAALGAKLVERMREARVQLRHREVQNVPYMTVSVGVAAIADPATRTLDDALAAVDRAVLEAKHAGRDRVASISG